MDRPLQEGDILAGKYRIERVLAQGGMGVVVAAIHQQLEQRVALKFLLPEGMQNEEAISRFLREAKAAVRLRSEHVARVLDVGTPRTAAVHRDGVPRGPRSRGRARGRGQARPDHRGHSRAPGGEAIAEAHSLGIIHRDLKPANLFLAKRADGTPCVKVLDFGISKLTTDLSTTKTTAVMGTPHYMAPEQLQSSKNVDMRTDIWSLGMILFELLSGSVAFRRDTLPGLCTAILFDPLPSVREATPDLPVGLELVVERALAKQPGDRQQTLAELATELAPFVPDGEMLAMRVRRVFGAGRPSAVPRRSDPALPSPGVPVEPAEEGLGRTISAPEARVVEASAEPPPSTEELPPSLVGIDDALPVRRLIFGALFAALLALALGVVLFTPKAEPPVPGPQPSGLVLVVSSTAPLAKEAPAPETPPLAAVTAAIAEASAPAHASAAPQTRPPTTPRAAASHKPSGGDDDPFGPRK